MATSGTSTWLQDNRYANLAFSAAVEGANIVFTTTDDTTGIATAYAAATDWTTIYGGLHILGETGQSIEIADPRVKPDRLTLKILDYAGALRTTLLAPSRANAGDAVTYLTQNLDNNDGTITVKSTTDFASSGTLYIGHEAITYSTKPTSTTFNGIVERGKWSLFNINAGTQFAKYHRVTPDVDGHRANSPRVTNWPSVWYGRRIGIFLHHKEPHSQAWTEPLGDPAAVFLWCGRIKGWTPHQDGTISIHLESVTGELAGDVFTSQFRGRLGVGQIMPNETHAKSVRLQVQLTDSTGTVEYDVSGDLTALAASPGPQAVAGRRYTWASYLDLLQHQFSTWMDGTDTYIHRRHFWSVEVKDIPDRGARVVFTLEVRNATITESAVWDVKVILPDIWWKLLGKTIVGPGVSTDGSYWLYAQPLQKRGNSTTVMELVLEGAPLDYVDPFQGSPGMTFDVTDITGEWTVQTSAYLPVKYQDEIELGDTVGRITTNATEGFLAVGEEGLVAIHKFHEDSDPTTGTMVLRFGGKDVGSRVNVRLGDAGVAPDVKQVWVETGTAGEILLRLMLSTGTSGYNHATYDVHPAGFGLGLPASMIDIASFERLRIKYELVLEKPRSFRDILESILAATGRYAIWKNGKITLTSPGFDSPNVEDIEEISESDKGAPDDIPELTISADSIINRVQLKYGPSELLAGGEIVKTSSVSDRVTAKSIVIEQIDSISEFGERKTVEIECLGIQDPTEWKDYVGAPLIAYFSRPVGTITRTISPQLLHINPGDIVKLTDNRIVDPRTGTYGIAGLACRVIANSFNWGGTDDDGRVRPNAGFGKLVLAFIPDHPASRYCKFAPSAQITAYNAGTRTATLAAHAYSASADDTDISQFAAGDEVRIIGLSPSNPASPTVYPAAGAAATIESMNTGANTLVFDVDPTGGAGLAAGTTWVLEYGSISQVVTAQQGKAFMASASSGNNPTTGLVANDARLLAGSDNRDFASWLSTTPTYTEQFVRVPDVATAQGRPYSTHTMWHLFNTCNNLLAHKTRPIYVNKTFKDIDSGTWPEHNATTQKMIWCQRIPLFGCDRLDLNGVRPLLVRALYGRTSGAGTNASIRITTSAAKPNDSNFLDVSFTGRYLQTSQTVTSSSPTWQSEFEITPVVVYDAIIPYTWLTLEITETGGATVQFRHLTIVEKKLS